MNGGPDLYYLRVHLTAGACASSTYPIKKVIKTDILLFQYCGNASTAANFVFAVPAPTAVTLQSFSAVPGDNGGAGMAGAASELDNLGFSSET